MKLTSVKEACEFYSAAQEYDIAKGVELARTFLLANESLDNLNDVHGIAHWFADPDLKEKSLEMVEAAFYKETQKQELHETDFEPVAAVSEDLERFKIEIKEEHLPEAKIQKAVSRMRFLAKEIRNIAALVIDKEVNVEFRECISHEEVPWTREFEEVEVWS